MPQHYVTATLLLVCLMGSGAHAAPSRPTGEWDGHNPVVTSRPLEGVVRGDVAATAAAATDAVAGGTRPQATLPLTGREASLLAVERQERSGRDDRDSVNGRQPHRVVQDWSLVCQQLCGAVGAGQPRSPPPSPAAAAVANRASGLRSLAGLKMCRDWCRRRNVSSICRCRETQEPHDRQLLHLPPEELLRERLDCEALCAAAILTDASANNWWQQLNTEAVTSPAASSDVLWQHLLRVLQQRRPLGGADPFAIAIPNKDPRQLLAVPKGRDAGRGEVATFDGGDAEPNWDELCVALCKTGDGGSLCSCDLSPFF